MLGSTFSIAGSGAGPKKKKARPLTRTEVKEAERLLAEQAYWTGKVDGVFDAQSRQALIAFQKVQGRDRTGKLTRAELEALRTSTRPVARDDGYAHVEVDLERQVLFMVGEDGQVEKILPVSSGSGKFYKEKRKSGTAYTPRGRFKVYNKVAGWRKSDLGLLYYPSYINDGIAIHGNPSVPTEPASHGCIRIPMAVSQTVYKKLPVGTIVLVYDERSFVSGKSWATSNNTERPIGIGPQSN
jgi:lipoprotein-anchoring transpeptidase ErfK/SrfK